MNIDLEKVKKEFIEYTNKYSLNDEKCKRKIGHSIRVMENCIKIATNMKLEQEKIQIAGIIGLLHDIGKLRQYKEKNTIEHGEYAAILLFDDGLIRNYIYDNKYDNIIKNAIRNHGKYQIEEGLTQEELLFARIVRDADKTDIFYETEEIFWKNEEDKVNKSILLENVYNQFAEKNIIKRNAGERLEYINGLVSIISFIFDINFKETFAILKEKDYINKILNRFDFEDEKTKERIEKIRKISNEYIDVKTKE